MPYITSVERIGIQKGIEQGMQQGMQQGARIELQAGIELGLELRFGAAGLGLLPEISKIQDIELLRTLRSALRTAPTLDDWRRLLIAQPQTETAH